MKRLYLFIAIMLIILGSAAKADKINVAVLSFTPLNEAADPSLGVRIKEKLIKELNSEAKDSVSIIERDDITKIVDEQALSKTGLIDESSRVALGKIKGVKYIISGNYTQTDTQFEIYVKAIDTQSGEIKFARDARGRTADQLDSLVRSLSFQLNNDFSGKSVTEMPSEGSFLNIDSTPRGAKVKVDGDIMGETPATIKLNEGDHKVEIDKEGYEPYFVDITLGKDQTKSINPNLVAKVSVGRLKIDSNPQGVLVLVDGIKMGTTPLILDNITAGKHTIALVHERYEPFPETEINVIGGRLNELKPVPELKEKTGILKILTNPSNAEVYIDGTLSGQTPFEKALPIGSYKIKLFLKDHDTIEDNVDIDWGQGKKAEFNLKECDGKITIRSTPQGAKVLIDDVEIGETPLEAQPVSSGTHNLKIEKIGWETIEKVIKVEPNQTCVIPDIALKRSGKGQISIKSIPPGAEIYIDGGYIGNTDYEGTDYVGQRKLELKKSGYNDLSDTIYIDPENPFEKTYTLERPYSLKEAAVSAGWHSFLFPGWGQFDIGNYSGAVLFSTSFLACVYEYFYYSAQADAAYSKYQLATTPSDAASLYKQAEDNAKTSTYFLYGSIIVWLWNMCDILNSRYQILGPPPQNVSMDYKGDKLMLSYKVRF